jgi:tetratricopeptide (TPR) repeat protein
VALAVCPANAQVIQPNATIALLDRYARGEHDAVARELAASPDFARIHQDLEKLGRAWTTPAGASASQVRRRQLVAASFALEAAAPRFWPEDVDPLVEWGCALLRSAPPDDAERAWQLAAVTIFGRARDDGSIVTRAGPGAPLGSRKLPPSRAVNHVAHAQLRFPGEPRFRLAAAMLLEVAGDTEPPRDAEWIATDLLPKNSSEAIRRATADRAIHAFEPLTATPALRAEAELHIGYLRMVLHEPAAALPHLTQARESGDPFIRYLAIFLNGRAAEMLGRPADAEAQYRAALTVMPHAQSASEALAARVFLDGKPDEAYALAEDALSARPLRDDPWHLFGYGDFRFIPELMADLRKVLQ